MALAVAGLLALPFASDVTVPATAALAPLGGDANVTLAPLTGLP